MKKLALMVAANVLTIVTVQHAIAQGRAHPASTIDSSDERASTAPDNSKSNKVDTSNQVTAQSQNNNSSDVGLTQRIRKSVMADKTLSTYAHNVKIVAVDGTVTLNGVVRTDEEKQRVAAAAEKIAGKEHVVNDLKVAPPKS